MKVKELIDILEKLDPETHVFVDGYEGGYDHASFSGDIQDFALNIYNEWYYGKHEKVQDADKKLITQVVKGIIL